MVADAKQNLTKYDIKSTYIRQSISFGFWLIEIAFSPAN